jgi:hypothetical protein
LVKMITTLDPVSQRGFYSAFAAAMAQHDLQTLFRLDLRSQEPVMP